jgi:S-adenosylmethionine:tRNA ribosyltransferase-isomerase
VRTSDFDYELPERLIAQQPIEPRDAARLLVLDRAVGRLAHHLVRDLPELLRPGDLVVANRSRVLPARVRGRLRGGGQAEVLLLRQLGPGRWQALARPARRLRPGDTVDVHDALRLVIADVHPEGVRDVVVQSSDANADGALLAAGATPLPPYIHGFHGDPERYQTIFAQELGSAAAPTAGLHFTPELVARLEQRGIDVVTLTLHVGLDTFRPITTEDPSAHRMHHEWYAISAAVQARVHATRGRAGRVVAIGTTTVRSLEAWAKSGQAHGSTDLFITPGFDFQLVDVLLTNFHLPRSTLLMLVSAFAGRERVLAAYAEAAQREYRFYSFGDAMLIL